MGEQINIEFTRFSAFYSPLIATFAAGFLKEQGLEARHSISAPGKSAIASLIDGSAHVVQSAPSQGFGPLEQGKTPPAVHFAQINEKDGFFLTGRKPEPAFSWKALEGKKVLVDHGGQPMAMFKYACFKNGLDFKRIQAVDAGSTEKMVAAFKGLKFGTPFGPAEFRALDNQSTMGIFVGRTAVKDGRGVMPEGTYLDGAKLQPADEQVRKLRNAS